MNRHRRLGCNAALLKPLGACIGHYQIEHLLQERRIPDSEAYRDGSAVSALDYYTLERFGFEEMASQLLDLVIEKYSISLGGENGRDI